VLTQPVRPGVTQLPDLSFAQLSKLRLGDRVEFFCRGRVRQLWVTTRADDVDRAARPLPKPIKRRSIRVTAAFGHGPGTVVECEWFAFEGQPTALAVVFG
jgi:hypothetical protein